MPPTKAIEAGLKGAHSGSRVLRLCTAPQELTPAQTPLRAAHLKAAAAHPLRLEVEEAKVFRDLV